MEHSILQMEDEYGMDRNAALADMRYVFIEGVCHDSVVKCHESREHIRSMRIDSVLTSKYWAIPIFLGIMLAIFWLTFSVIGISSPTCWPWASTPSPPQWTRG